MRMRDRVALGAAFLDVREPGWEKRVDPDSLHMGRCDECILGQLHGDYVYGLKVIGLDAEAGLFGFEFEDKEHEYSALTRLWRRLIRERRAA